MRIVLHPDLQLQGRVLVDTRIGARYTLTADTTWLLQQLLQMCESDEVVASAVATKHISTEEAKRSLYALVGYLDAFGGVRAMWHDRFGMLPVRLRWHHRYVPSLKGFCSAMWHAYGLLIILMSLAMLGLYVRPVGGSPLFICMPFVLLFSCVVHELGHFVAIRLYRVPHVLLARVGYAAVVYVCQSGTRARLIAMSGPLLACLTYMGAGLLSATGTLKIGLMITGVIHACNMLPFFADGKTIWRIHG